jgi:hypothetical protein
MGLPVTAQSLYPLYTAVQEIRDKQGQLEHSQSVLAVLQGRKAAAIAALASPFADQVSAAEDPTFLQTKIDAVIAQIAALEDEIATLESEGVAAKIAAEKQRSLGLQFEIVSGLRKLEAKRVVLLGDLKAARLAAGSSSISVTDQTSNAYRKPFRYTPDGTTGITISQADPIA